MSDLAIHVLQEIVQRVLAHESLVNTLQIHQLLTFLEHTRRLLPDIVGTSGVLPLTLPAHPAAFLSAQLGLPPAIVALSWIAFSDIIVKVGDSPFTSFEDGFRAHGRGQLISQLSFCLLSALSSNPSQARNLYGPRLLHALVWVVTAPPSARRRISRPGSSRYSVACSRSDLTPCTVPVSLPYPCMSSICSPSPPIACHTRFHPNYYVKDASREDSVREWYDSAVPEFIHITQKTFVESKLCEYFEYQMAMTQCVNGSYLYPIPAEYWQHFRRRSCTCL